MLKSIPILLFYRRDLLPIKVAPTFNNAPANATPQPKQAGPPVLPGLEAQTQDALANVAPDRGGEVRNELIEEDEEEEPLIDHRNQPPPDEVVVPPTPAESQLEQVEEKVEVMEASHEYRVQGRPVKMEMNFLNPREREAVASGTLPARQMRVLSAKSQGEFQTNAGQTAHVLFHNLNPADVEYVLSHWETMSDSKKWKWARKSGGINL